MSYTKQNFTDGTVLTAAHLNHMEEGIINAEQTGGTAELTIGTVTSGSTASASISDGRLNLVLPKGETGPQGAKGDTGATGAQGAKGDTGAQGPQGEKGDTGPAGANGKDGAKGEKGDTGPAGEQGPGITDTAKTLMLSLFEGAAYGNAKMQATLDALKTEWGTSGGDSGGTTEDPQNTNPFPSIEAAYLLPKAKTFVPSAKEYIDTGLKLFENETPGNWTILFELQCGEALVAKSDTYVVAHCMEESTPWPGFTLQVAGTSMQSCYFSGKGNLASISELKASKCRMAVRFKGTAYTGGQISGNLASWGTVTGYTTVNKTLILGAYQQSDGTKGRFFDGTLYQCIVYNSALTDDQLREWLAG